MMDEIFWLKHLECHTIESSIWHWTREFWGSKRAERNFCGQINMKRILIFWIIHMQESETWDMREVRQGWLQELIWWCFKYVGMLLCGNVNLDNGREWVLNPSIILPSNLGFLSRQKYVVLAQVRWEWKETLKHQTRINHRLWLESFR
jgi:hypothetical protein